MPHLQPQQEEQLWLHTATNTFGRDRYFQTPSWCCTKQVLHEAVLSYFALLILLDKFKSRLSLYRVCAHPSPCLKSLGSFKKQRANPTSVKTDLVTLPSISHKYFEMVQIALAILPKPSHSLLNQLAY